MPRRRRGGSRSWPPLEGMAGHGSSAEGGRETGGTAGMGGHSGVPTILALKENAMVAAMNMKSLVEGRGW